MPFVELVGVAPINLNLLIGYAIVKDETVESYRWVLAYLCNLLGYHVSPHVIFTDRELGLVKPIYVVFPYYAHFLCTWHIN